MFKQLLWAAIFFCCFILISCGESSDKTTGGDSYTANNDTETSSDSDSAVKKNEPGSEFKVSAAENYLYYDFKGLINSQQDYEASKGTVGMGKGEITLAGKDKITISENIMASRTTIPDDYSIAEMRGKQYLMINGYNILEGTANSAKYIYLGMGLPVEALAEMKTAGNYQSALPKWSWINFYNVTINVRKDGVNLSKYCYISKADYADQNSKIFINSDSNTNFDAGENILAWGNITLVKEYTVTPETEKDYCFFYKDSVIITKDEYDIEILKDGTEFDCALPDKYLDPFSESYGAFKFKGYLNDFNIQNNNPKAGFGDYKVFVKNIDQKASDYRVMSGVYSQNGTDAVYIQSLGSVTEKGDKHYSYKITESYISRPALKALVENAFIIKNEGADYTKIETLNFVFNVYDLEEKLVGNDYYLKYCPVAVADLKNADSSIFSCHNKNIEFAVGEDIQIAGNIALTDDPDMFSLALGVELTNGCYCIKNSALSDCSAFE